MSRLHFTYVPVATTPAVFPETLAQFKAATNQRCVIKKIELNPLGVTAASAPLLFDLIIQTNAGGMTDDSGNISKVPPAAGETIQTTILKRGGAEPTLSGNAIDRFSLHQQGSRIWRPAVNGDEVIVLGNTRMGFRYLSSVLVLVQVTYHLEE